MSNLPRRAWAWLFARRPVRPQRPARRAGPVLFLAGCGIAYAAGATSIATTALIACTVMLLILEVV